MTTVKEKLRILRVNEVMLMLGFPFIGVIFAWGEVTSMVIIRSLLFLVFTFFLFSAIYSFNSYCDPGDGLKNHGLLPIKGDGRGELLIFTLVFLGLSLLGYQFLDTKLVYMGGVSFMLWFFYSLPGRGLKSFPFTGTAVHFVSQVLHFQMGFYLLSPISEYSLLISVYFAILFSGGHVHHELIDYENDMRAKIKTGAIYLGQHKAFYLSNILFIISAVFWMSLYGFNVLKSWEFLPFFAAFLLQMATVILLRMTRGKDFGFLLLNRSLYRVYYLAGGIIYAVLHIVYLGE